MLHSQTVGYRVVLLPGQDLIKLIELCVEQQALFGVPVAAEAAPTTTKAAPTMVEAVPTIKAPTGSCCR